MNQSLIILSLGIIGGILPDLDSDQSTPVQIVFKILSIFIPLLVLLIIPQRLPILNMLGIWLISTFILKILFNALFLKLTTHRGVFHTVPMGIFFSQLVVLLFFYVLNFDIRFSTIAGIFLFLGFLVHLLLDELVSLNLLGLKVKSSFGTAFKFYDKNNKTGTLLLYLSIFILHFYIPISDNIYSSIFKIFTNLRFV